MSDTFSEEEFVALVAGIQRPLAAFVRTLVPGGGLADDILQETNLVLWRKRQEFQPGTNFRAWAFRVARFQVLARLQREQRDRLMFDEELIEQLADDAAAEIDTLEQRRGALAACLEQLPSRDLQLIKWRFMQGLSACDVAQRDGRSLDGIYYALRRIYGRLLRCIELRTAQEGLS